MMLHFNTKEFTSTSELRLIIMALSECETVSISILARVN